MKKVIINEKQAKKLMGKLISEQYTDDDRYRQEVTCQFGYHGLTYKGGEIDWIPDATMTVSFRIDMEARSYGIKSISVYDFQGPSEVVVPVTYYPEGSDDSVDEDVVIKLNWDDVTTDDAVDVGWIGIDNVVEVELSVDESGNFISKGILIFTNTI